MVLAYKIAQVCVCGGGTFLEAGRAAFKGVQRVVLAYKIAQVRGVLVVWGVLCVYGRGGRGLFPHRQKRCVVICAEGFWVSGRGWSVPPLECLLLCLPFKPSLPFPPLSLQDGLRPSFPSSSLSKPPLPSPLLLSLQDGLRPSFPQRTPEEYSTLAEQCWSAAPAAR